MEPLRKQDASGSNRSIVIIPTYNEAENVPIVLDEIMTLPERVHALVVDDGSPDGTADCVRVRMAKHPGRISLIEREGKMGLGTAYLRGFDWRSTGTIRSYAAWTRTCRITLPTCPA